MSVYVDPLTFFTNTPLGDREWSHMWADDVAELHAMADKIGMKRSWFQDHSPDPRHHHYDLVASKRKLAIKHGAIEMTFLDWLRMKKKELENGQS